MTMHRRLEERIAGFKGTQSAVLFGSGYLANLGVIPALAQRGEIVFSDELNHASIIDGCRLAGAETFVYRHGDVDHLTWGLRNADGRGALIVTDGVFSMDGDVAPLEEIVELARRHDVRLMVDDAHGTGTLGPGGRGAVADAGLDGEVDVIVGTLGKALGSYGAFVACDDVMARYLVNSARSLIFSTGLPPAAVAAAMAALELLQEQPRRVERLADNSEALRDELAREGFDVSGSETQIVPLIVGDAGLAMRICEAALEQGVFAQAIRPPTVAEGTSRLRLAVMASHTKTELREAARVLAQAALRNGFRPSSTRAGRGGAVRRAAAARVRRRRGRAAPAGGVSCAGCSSRAPTPRPARRSSRARLRPRCVRAASASRRTSRSSPGSTSPPRRAGRAITSCSRPQPACRSGRSRRTATGRPSRRTSPPSWPGSSSTSTRSSSRPARRPPRPARTC